ncbi:MAG: T9SS type A sorting domain-containing protein [Bacteroidota bacterium]
MKNFSLFILAGFVCTIVNAQNLSYDRDTTELEKLLNISQDNHFLSDPFPNPVHTTAQINYKLPYNTDGGCIVIYNILGNEVRRIKVDHEKIPVIIIAEDFKSGTYFYGLEYNGKMSETKRLIISH